MSILAEKADFLSGDSANSLAGLLKKKKPTHSVDASVFTQVFAPNPRPARCERNPPGNRPSALEVHSFPVFPVGEKLKPLVSFV